MIYEPIIGLEVHVELATQSKMFCGCPADHFGKEPNTQMCPVCLALPGALPVPNRKAVAWTILMGLALRCSIPEMSKFDRKNYFYPDLPKGYQISQYDMPLADNGSLELSNYPINQSSNQQTKKKIRIRRVHLEEDTGKLQHATIDGERVSLVDFNRSGVPLMEIVTEPDFRSIEEVDLFLKKLQQIIRYLGISNADMEKGVMRLEPSISILPISDTTNIQFPIPENELPKYRVEIKNINSFRFARKAIESEIERQTELLKKGETPTQQTRGWSEAKGTTLPQREKEEAHDYRYFPEPDIPPMRWNSQFIDALRESLPELPDEKKRRFIKEYALSEYDATILTDTRERSDFYEECVKKSLRQSSGQSNVKDIIPKTIANIIINKKIDISTASIDDVVRQFTRSIQTSAISDKELESVIKKVLTDNPKAVGDYKKGKEQAVMFLIGQIMRSIKGKFPAETIRQKVVSML